METKPNIPIVMGTKEGMGFRVKDAASVCSIRLFDCSSLLQVAPRLQGENIWRTRKVRLQPQWIFNCGTTCEVKELQENGLEPRLHLSLLLHNTQYYWILGMFDYLGA